MKFYHGTSEEKWSAIQEEGVLWGIRNAPSRCTYLATTPKGASYYGDVLLEVEYTPDNSRQDEIGAVHNYWDENCWQLRVYEPIPIKRVRRLS